MYFIRLVGTICCILKSLFAFSWEKDLVHKIKNELSPYQVTIFNTELDPFVWRNQKCLQEMMANLPAVSIDLNGMKNNNRSLKMKVHGNPRAARALYAIFEESASLHRLKDTIDVFVKLAPTPTRPKCMLIIHGNEATFENNYRVIFEYAWSLNFLEFLILQYSDNKTAMLIDYDVFTRKISYKNLNSTNRLFSDKLQNINQYPLKMMFFKYSPHSFISIDNRTGQKRLSGINMKPIEIFLRQINASVNYVDLRKNVTAGTLQKVTMEKLSENQATLLHYRTAIGTVMYNWQVIPSKAISNYEIIFFTPLITFSKLNLPPTLFVNWFCLIAAIFSLDLIVNICKINAKKWILGEMFQLAFGVPIKKQFFSISERLTALSLMLLSITYSTDLVANLIDVKMLKEEIPFNDMTDILKSNLSIHTYTSLSKYALEHYSEGHRLATKVTRPNTPFNCLKGNNSDWPLIYMISPTKGLYELSKHLECRLNIVRTQFYTDFMAYPFEKASPYVEKFNDILTRLTEAAITYDRKDEFKRKKLELQEKLINESSVLTIMLIVLITGYTVAIVVFIFELIAKWMNKIFSFILSFS